MIRTQIQIPEDLYRKLKQIGTSQEWSLSEVVRRGAELIVRMYDGALLQNKTWTPPQPRSLGKFRAAHTEWRELAGQHEDPA